jgi:acylphosphatase
MYSLSRSGFSRHSVYSERSLRGATSHSPLLSFVTISRSVASEKQARRYFVSGMVQGVGFRYFTQDVAERLHLTGFVRNLRDGRVEVFAIGGEEQLSRLRNALEKGPRGAMVHGVAEELAGVDPRFDLDFSITYDQ